MPNVGELNVKISLDDSEFQAGLNRLKQQISSLNGIFSNTFNSLSSNISNNLNKISSSISGQLGKISSSINGQLNTLATASNKFNNLSNEVEKIDSKTKQYNENVKYLSNSLTKLADTMLKNMGVSSGYDKTLQRVTNTAMKIPEKIGNGFSGAFGRITNGVKSTISGIGSFINGVRNAVPQVLRLTLAVSGMTYVLGTLRNATSAYINSNAQLQSSVAGCTQALGQALAPAIHLAVGALQILVKWITTAIAYLFTLINVLFGTKLAITTTFKPLEKATAGGSRGMKKLSKDSKKAFSILAPFDELNILDPKNKDKSPRIKTPNVGGAGGGITPNFADITPRINPEELNKFAEQAKALWDRITEPWKQIDVEPAIASFGRLWDSIKRFSEPLGQGLLWFNDNVLAKLAQWTMEQLVPTFLDTLAQTLDFLGEVIKAVSPGLLNIYEHMLKPIAELAGQIVIDFLKGLQQGLKDLTDSGIIKGLGNIYTGFTDIMSVVWDQLIATVKDVYENLKKLGSWAWEGLVNGLKAIVQDGNKINEKVLQPVANWLKENPWLVEKLTKFILALVGAWIAWNAAIAIFNALCAVNPWQWIIIGIVAVTTVIVLLIAYWDDIIAAARNFFDNLRQNNPILNDLANKFEFLTGIIKQAWEWIKKIGQSIKDAFSGAGNIIGGIAGSIGGLFGGGGRSVQVNGVPAMASGGVLTSPSLILAGEYSGASTNPEIVSPQSLMYDTVQQALQNNQSYPQDMTISINLGGVEVGREIINLINMTQRNSGETLLEV